METHLMSKRGRKPTPTPLLRLRGSFRHDRHGQRLDAAGVDHKRPACPKRFIVRQENEDGEAVRLVAKSTWDRLAPALHRAGLLVEMYRVPFELLCDSYGRYVLACEKCNQLGMTTTGSKQNEIKSPWVQIRNDMWKQTTDVATRFGLTPADLARVQGLDPPTADDAKSRFFGPGA